MPSFGQNNSFKEELNKLFMGLPISDGYNAIVNNPKIIFEEEKKYLPLPGLGNKPSSLVHFAKIDNRETFFGNLKKIEIEVEKSIIDTLKGNYGVVIRYYFNDKDEVVGGYNLLKQKIEKFIEPIESRQIKSKKNKIVEENAVFKLNDKNVLPYIIIYYDKESAISNQLILIYHSEN